MRTNPHKKTVINIVTLGCAKNLVDSERLARQLEINGVKILHNSDSTKARIVVISYHSLEDRLVKNIMKTGNLEGVLSKDFYGNEEAPMKMIL